MTKLAPRATTDPVVVVDSTVWIDFFNGASAPWVSALAVLLHDAAPIAVPDVVAMEVLQGFRSNRDFDAVEKALSEFEQIEVGGLEACIAAARRYRRMRTAGVTPRKSIDVLIASWCIDHGARLLHHDRDFEAMESLLGLRVIDFAQSLKKGL